MKKTKGVKKWTQRKKPKYLGFHLIAEFWGGKIINDPKKLEELLRLAAKEAKNTPLKFSFYKFNPRGLTGVLLLAESHISFHSWPEYKYLALDVFTCGANALPEKALEILKKKLKPKKIEVRKIKRGKL